MLGPLPDESRMSTSGVLVRVVTAGFFTDVDQMGSKTHRTVAAGSIFLYWDIGLRLLAPANFCESVWNIDNEVVW